MKFCFSLQYKFIYVRACQIASVGSDSLQPQGLEPARLICLQDSLSMGFFRQEYQSGLPCPPPGDLLDPGIELQSLTSPALAGGFFTTSTTWDIRIHIHRVVISQNTRSVTLIFLAKIPSEPRGVGGRLKKEGIYTYLELIQVVVQQKAKTTL